MVAIDVLAVVSATTIFAIWIIRRAALPARRAASLLSERADDIAVDVAARGLRAGRKLNSTAKIFAERVRERADEGRK